MSDPKDTIKNNDMTQAPMLDGLKAQQAATRAAGEVSTNVSTFTQAPPKDYNVELIQDFLDIVFHAPAVGDEQLLTWMVSPSKSPAFPKTEAALIDLLAKTRLPKALYFGTAMVTPDKDDGKLYNRKSTFSSLRVIVLDDIGTKVKFEDMPEGLEPTYKLQSSEGNYQWGLVLDPPITDFAAAEALVQMVYESGYTDEGGKMPTKLVRLPEGVNGKKGKENFPSTLDTLTDKFFSPQQVMDALNINERWEDVLADADAVAKRRASHSLGATPWANAVPQAAALNGMVDPVLEWLYETNQVVTDNGGDCVDILCPWPHESVGDTAGYFPLGRGDDVTRRGFHCFHGGCSANNTSAFLRHVAAASGIEAGVTDPAAALTTQFVFDKMENAVWDIKAFRRDIKFKMDAFANLRPHTHKVYDLEGKPHRVGEVAMWKTSASRVVVAGAQFDPSTTARIIERNGERYVNLFSIPSWGNGPIEDRHVTKFQDYLDYLIPDKQDREYFTMWLAAKCQDMSFRGAALVMIAPNQGVGRSTLGDMIKTLMGEPNAATISLADMLGDSQFNEWQGKPFIITEETLAGERKDYYSNYEKLKGFIDPRSGTITINPKFGKKYETTNYASHLFLTQHSNAIAIPDNDRRFYVMDNAFTPASPSYFTKVNKWLEENDVDGLPAWGRHVYRWLQNYEVDMESLMAPPPKTAAKTAMAEDALSDMDFAVNILIKVWPDAYLSTADAVKVFSHPLLAGPLRFDEKPNIKFVRRKIKEQTIGFPQSIMFRFYGATYRPRVLKVRLLDDPNIIAPDDDDADIGDVMTRIHIACTRRGEDVSATVAAVKSALEAEGRI